MDSIQRKVPLDEWPKEARLVDQAGKNLQLRPGEELLTTEDIQREIKRLGRASGCNVRPTDYCYNRINKDPRSCRHPVFKWVELGKFRYLGPNCDYTGSILWKPIGEPERQVGEWKSGVCYLECDPRNA
jgi:hypothetical protein